MNSINSEKHEKNFKLVYGGLLTAIGVLLPQVFHLFGQNAGMIFLPMELPVLFAGLFLGGSYGTLIGVLVPVISAFLTGMPPVPKVYFMLPQFAAYGMTAGLLIRKHSVYSSLAAAMLTGRICYGAAAAAGVHLLHRTEPFLSGAAVAGSILTGIPGMILQILIIPLLYRALKRGGLTGE